MPILTVSPHHISLGEDGIGRGYGSEDHPLTAATFFGIMSCSCSSKRRLGSQCE
jgi:hypothetical protein